MTLTDQLCKWKSWIVSQGGSSGEDLWSEVALKALSRFDRADILPEPFLRRIVRTAKIDLYRTDRKHSRNISLERDEFEDSKLLYSNRTPDFRQDLVDFIGHLTNVEQDVINSFLAGESFRLLAGRTGVCESTLYKRFERAVKKLRILLCGCG